MIRTSVSLARLRLTFYDFPMAVETGRIAYLQLASTFDNPRWREAVVLQHNPEWVRVAVRAKRPSEIGDQFTTFSHDGKCYFLVELRHHQLSAFHGGACLQLGAETDVVIAASTGLFDSEEDLVFASASEEAAQSKAKTKQDRNPQMHSSSSSSEESADLTAALTKLKKTWLGGGTEGDAVEKKQRGRSEKREKFPLLTTARKKSQDKEDKRKDLLNPDALIASLNQDQDPLRALLTMQLAEALGKKLNRRKHRKKSSSSRSCSSQTSRSARSSSSEGSSRKRGHAKAIAQHQAAKKKMFRRPLRYVRGYVKEVEAELGTAGKPYHLHEAGRRIAWGKQKSLQRVHFLLSEILTAILEKKHEEAALQTVLALRATHQAALDGDWSLAWLLTHQPNVWEKRQWGGTPEELGNVAAYLKSMDELNRHAEKARSSHQPWLSQEHTAGADKTDKAPKGQKPSKGAKGRGKSKEEEKADRQD